ncbi:MAG: hypothetical protein EPN82_03105 [Bacteroidetes bacterium]|nr:MAG: hypothetical protein EPN82_03105 [Bacteroidota bacterium]
MKSKKYIQNLLIIIAVLLFVKPAVYSQETLRMNPKIQENKPLSFNIGLSYTNSIPLHDYSKDLLNSPHGFSFNASIKPKDFPLSFGLNLEYLFLNEQSYRNTYVSGTYADGWTSGITFPFNGQVGYGSFLYPDDIYHIINSIVPVSIYTRFHLFNNNYIQPYAEFSVGINTLYLFGIPSYKFDNSNVVNLRFYSYFLTYFYGISLGATINPNEIIAISNFFTDLRLNLNCRYTKGFQYKYMNYFLSGNQSSEQNIFIDAQKQIDFIFYSFGFEYQI